MSSDLLDSLKELLTWFVEETRKGNLDEEFWIIGAGNDYIVNGYRGDENNIPSDITNYKLRILQSDDLILIDPAGLSSHCTLQPKAYELVDSNFEDSTLTAMGKAEKIEYLQNQVDDLLVTFSQDLEPASFYSLRLARESLRLAYYGTTGGLQGIREKFHLAELALDDFEKFVLSADE